MLRGKIFLGLIVACIIFAADHQAMSQEFPYAAPQAPEFDDLGNVVAPGESEAAPPRRTRQSSPRRERSNVQPPSEYGVVRPYTPPDMTPSPPPAPQPSWPQQAPNYRSAQPMAPHAAAPPSRPPAQAPDRPDCSQFPMMIARARSEPEMQNIARQYLTCLLKNGWNMEQARTQVISTIESTYRLAR